MSRVDIGFAEECEPWQLKSSLFPSKIGGKPAWLDLQNLPNPEELECANCKKLMIFLLQVYAPYEEDPNSFHRTLFVFICRNSECSKLNDSNNIVVFRSNLRRDNMFYSYEPPNEESRQAVSTKKFATLCEICGCLAPKRCSKCKQTAYCNREHQVIGWKRGHKNNCENIESEKHRDILFSEYEMVVEPEEIDKAGIDEEKEIEVFKKLEQEGKTGVLNDVSELELDAHASTSEDKVFMTFQKRIFNNKEQVLRYERGGQPLWIAKEPLPNNIPNCDYCGDERQFEFQIMPQLLTVLKETEIDWGVLAVYSCTKSCDIDKGYRKEYIFKQDISEN